MKYRKLRIAWSVGWGVAAVLLCVLWVRSYLSSDFALGAMDNNRAFNLNSVLGRLVIVTTDYPPSMTPPSLAYGSFGSPIDIYQFDHGFGGFYIERNPGTLAVVLPYWSFVFAAATLAALPWLPKRFSLRTLLIATTLVAVVLGLTAWLAL